MINREKLKGKIKNNWKDDILQFLRTVLAILLYVTPFATSITFIFPVSSLAISSPVAINPTIETTASSRRASTKIFTRSTRTAGYLNQNCKFSLHSKKKFTNEYKRYEQALTYLHKPGKLHKAFIKMNKCDNEKSKIEHEHDEGYLPSSKYQNNNSKSHKRYESTIDGRHS